MVRLISKLDFEDIRALVDQVHTIHVKIDQIFIKKETPPLVKNYLKRF